MAATGRDGGRGPSWSYRRHEETGTGTITSSYTTSSSRSGTIVSTAYTSSASRHSSSSISMESAALLQLDLELDVDTSSWIETGKTLMEKKMMMHMESLVQEFFHGLSENRSILGGSGGIGALERWFSELGVSWVLQLDVEHPTGGDTWSWIIALEKIMESIRLTESFFPDHGHGFVGMPGISEEEVESGKQASLDPIQFALFFRETMAKMLVFVDVMFGKSISIRGTTHISNSLVSCLRIYCALSNSALSKTLSGIRLQFDSSPLAEVEKIKKEMVSLLSSKQGKAFEAIWSTLEEIRTHALKSMEECSVMDHIKFLLGNHWAVDSLVSQAASLGKYVPQTGLGGAPPFISLITEMVSCLEEKLITKSQLFLDKGLGLLFLLNNLNFIQKQLQHTLSYIKVGVEIVTCKDELGHYIESYIQVSWAPMLSCLSNHTPLCLGRNYSPLSKFESEFQKIYTSQKLCKVPDPELRKKVRKAIIEKIIPGYTEYVKDNKVTNPKFSPQELEEMLQELFEG